MERVNLWLELILIIVWIDPRGQTAVPFWGQAALITSSYPLNGTAALKRCDRFRESGMQCDTRYLYKVRPWDVAEGSSRRYGKLKREGHHQALYIYTIYIYITRCMYTTRCAVGSTMCGRLEKMDVKT